MDLEPWRARRSHRLRLAAFLTLLAVVGAACSSSASTDGDAAATPQPSAEATAEPTAVPGPTRPAFPPAPFAPDGPIEPDAQAGIEAILGTLDLGFVTTHLPAIEASQDPRLAWLIADFIRVMPLGEPVTESYVRTAEAITGAEVNLNFPWRSLTDHLIAWDTPAPPNYVAYKGQLFTALDERWAFVFSDPDATLDYRHLGWGGVRIDDRELGDPERCVLGCIPALDDPALTDAASGGWYPDDAVVFGVIIDGDAVAFPKNIMEIHEMVNMTIGGRRVGIPYCTLCGSAQAYLTDEVEGVDRPPVLRTSGLLVRSNKVMYDLDSRSVFDTFTGEAVTGPLREAGVVLNQVPIITTTWADWRATHPDTRIIAEDGGIGRDYPLDPLRGRDDNGPIFPIGDADPRLPVQEPVLGVLLDDGTAIAVPVAAARAALEAGDAVEVGGIAVELDGAGVVATQAGERLGSHQAFWFAWSQFHPETLLWPEDS